MKVTVCELSEDRMAFQNDWKNLAMYVALERPNLLLLPEMPFFKWIAAERKVSEAQKHKSISDHKQWLSAIEKLEADHVVYSMPEFSGLKFLNTAYIYSKKLGHRPLHSKAYFPEEPHFWEESWFDRTDSVEFTAFELEDFRIGLLLCTELWFTEKARHYGKQGVDLLLCPRATGKGSIEQWINCGRTSAVVSGAYCLSSNRSGQDSKGFQWGGAGWIASPKDGGLMGITSEEAKFISVTINLQESRSAKMQYPLYVRSSGF